ncbi:MAG: hypothetical protein DVB23_001704 [Verrucomicrobia bacterium]|jgi:hypothetical protein|nr:MAG: hypothetical protein DVB23_001704 [Verrucomicrobiota bacterium]
MLFRLDLLRRGATITGKVMGILAIPSLEPVQPTEQNDAESRWPKIWPNFLLWDGKTLRRCEQCTRMKANFADQSEDGEPKWFR